MNKIPEAIEHKQLLKRLVLDCETVQDQGQVAELWLNPQSHQVIGFTCKSGIFNKQKKYFAWKQIDTVGTDAILVNLNVEPNQLEKPHNIVDIIGNEVWTDTGDKVGFIVEYLLNFKTGEITNYLFKYNSWWSLFDSIYLLSPEAVSTVGTKRVIVTKATIEEPELYTERVNQKIQQIQEFLEADLVRTKKHIDVARSETQKLAVGFQARAQIVKKQAQETAKVVAEQAQQKVEEFQGKSVERKTKLNSDRFHSKIQQVTTQAKEKIDGVKSQWKNSSTTEKDRDNL
ncbi:MAG: photosystem reaction center subunit H [Microcoleaceae cyanobacterium]